MSQPRGRTVLTQSVLSSLLPSASREKGHQKVLGCTSIPALGRIQGCRPSSFSPNTFCSLLHAEERCCILRNGRVQLKACLPANIEGLPAPSGFLAAASFPRAPRWQHKHSFHDGWFMILPYCPAISEQWGCNRRRLRAQERRELLHCRVPVVSMASAWQDSSTAFLRVWTLDTRRGSTSFPFLSISARQPLTAPILKHYFSK